MLGMVLWRGRAAPDDLTRAELRLLHCAFPILEGEVAGAAIERSMYSKCLVFGRSSSVSGGFLFSGFFVCVLHASQSCRPNKHDQYCFAGHACWPRLNAVQCGSLPLNAASNCLVPSPSVHLSGEPLGLRLGTAVSQLLLGGISEEQQAAQNAADAAAGHVDRIIANQQSLQLISKLQHTTLREDPITKYVVAVL